MTQKKTGENALVDRLGGDRSAKIAKVSKLAKTRLSELIEAVRAREDSAALVPHLEEGPFRNLVGLIFEHSPFLSRLASRPERLARLALASPEESHARIVAEQRGRFRAVAAGEARREDVAKALRRARAEHALLVALADIGGVWDVDRVVAALSDFADASVAGATDTLLVEAAAAGKLTLPDPEEPGRGTGAVVLALGKHGGRELNYSSDIDLVVFFDPACAALKDPLDAPPFYARLAQNLAKMLQERTGEGYVHRVDYRLRPDPGSTPVAVALPSAYSYYESVGQNWERAALIKARPIAGDLPLGESFLAELAPFIWRKYFDFAAIADVHAMKRQIHAVRGHAEIAVAGHDIKLGRGGIREIEFFVQTQQLVFGGRRPSLRGRRTLEMLAELEAERWISAEARDELTAAYRFLRGIEHRLQMVADEQTQRLPADEATLEGFSRFCGYKSAKAFGTALTGVARTVQKHYALLFEEGPELASEAGSLVFTGAEIDPETLGTLRKMGFRDPEKAAETVRGWHFGRRPAITSARAREVLTELTPALLAALGGTADPDGALERLDAVFGRMKAAVELMTILLNHDRLLTLFADLLGTAPRLADTVARRPHVLDAIIDPAFGDPIVDEAQMLVQVRDAIGRSASYEDFLDRTRDVTRQATFVTGARMLSGVFSPERAGQAYAAIAQAIVQTSYEAVEREFAADYGRVPGGRIAVLGLGRLGTREMTATSDLDLVVLYDFDQERRESDGRRAVDATVYYTRLVQRLVSALTAPTRRGALYEVDLRLRPSGRSGPVATQFRGFVSYQREDAELWEHMALTRARVVAGDGALAEDATRAIADVVGLARDPAVVAREVLSMRRLIAKEKGEGDPWDMKLAAGGLTDLDFLAQAYVLTHAHADRDLVGLSPGAALARAGEAGFLTPEEADALVAAQALLSRVFHWQRLTVEGRFDPKSAPPAILRRLAAEAGVPDPARLEAELAQTRKRVREIFERRLQEMSGGNAGA
ncbi:bifunctional [glutamine synthetase] adenylyltransferase/[glutamine synthetase]-adenylyl-L-tyrosine phosphorylase [Salinarimonas ramus]|uniref:Bifunctional glutamine synthetase adenylyltransferase/adenylyl-removing enzyme n=1 Tax=Salinarimonas ramus TaxID=690164 RepID=A0A917Q8T0_9HYPH|nr:bifunctional [glutamine synthetase] adenylyltransferase/[glutamine synthetase]-adenylyl-L-tyrosine phosphorylase [Salinarimonas ramus]GGK36910.1 glutamate-ammonia-ligase adenylyltransferase [Salinarimonas ramus]